MGADELERREFLENAAHDQPRQGQGIVHRPPHARGQPIVLHAFLAETDRGRVDHHRHVELGRQLEERQRVVIIRIAALEARCDPCAFEPILLHRALEFAQELVAAIGNRRGHPDDGIVFGLASRVELILPLAPIELLPAIHVAQIVNRIADDGDIDAADLRGFERVLDRGRAAALFGRPDIAMELGARERLHVCRRQDMHMKIDDHGQSSFRIAIGDQEFGSFSARV